MGKEVLTVGKLLKWINADPYNEALLIKEVPVAASTLNRIKNGSYMPGDLLARRILSVIVDEYPGGFKKR